MLDMVQHTETVLLPIDRTKESVLLPWSGRSLSPDGKYLAVLSRLRQNEDFTYTSRIRILPTQGGESRTIREVLNQPGVRESLLGWTADSKNIILRREAQIFRLPINGDAAVRIDLPGGGDTKYVSCTPDMKIIAYVQEIRERAEVWAMDNFLWMLK